MPRGAYTPALLRMTLPRREKRCRRAGTLVAAAERAVRVPVAERLADADLDRWQACLQLVRSYPAVVMPDVSVEGCAEVDLIHTVAVYVFAFDVS